MRLNCVEHGHDLPTRITLRAMAAVSRVEVPEIVKVTTYRHRFFGTPYTDLVQDLMRGPSEWSVGERELFAAFTSSRNRCRFCTSAHQAVASSYLSPELVATALRHPGASDQRPEVVAVLEFLDKLALSPDEVSPDDVARVRAAGVSEGALDDAVRISVAFHLINRVLDALGAGPIEGRSQRFATTVLRKLGYPNPPTVRFGSRAH